MTARWCSTVDARSGNAPESGSLGTPIRCVRCGVSYLPTRERLAQVLNGAIDNLNHAKLGDALRGNLADDTIENLAAVAYALLYSSSMLEHCEPCIKVKIETAAAVVVARTKG